MYKKFIILNINYILRSKVRDYLSNIEVEGAVANDNFILIIFNSLFFYIHLSLLKEKLLTDRFVEYIIKAQLNKRRLLGEPKG